MYKGNYKKASDVFRFKIQPNGNIDTVSNTMHSSSIINPNTANNVNNKQMNLPKHMNKNNTIQWKPKEATLDMRDPEVFGPPLWFTLHNGATNYPEIASPIISEKMKNFILGLPYIISCENCQSHAIAYIEEHYEKMCEACKGRDELFKFFFDFHNYVNKRLKKPEMKLEDAIKLYSNGSKIHVMKY